MVLGLTLTLFSGGVLVNYAHSAVKPAPDKGEAEYRRALVLIKQGKNSEALPLLETARRKDPDNPRLLADYLSTLVWLHRYDTAINLYGPQKNKVKAIKYLYRNMAKAYYETGDYHRAHTLYAEAFSFDHADVEALKGLIFSGCKLYVYQQALQAWLTAYQKKTIPLASLEPLRIYLTRHMGAPTLTLQYAREAGIKDKTLLDTLIGDVAAERIKWDEYDVAIRILEQELQKDPNNYRARGDYILALRDKYRMKEALEQYQILEKSGRPAPYWVTEAVADALLYLKRPWEAEKFYKLTLEHTTLKVPINTYMGLFSTYIELRQWDQADQARDRIKDFLKQRKLNIVEKDGAWTAIGWYFIYKDQLQEAQDYFNAALREAGLNPAFRSSLGNTFYYRGWPQKALEKFKIALAVDPQEKSARVSEAYALNELNHKYAARELAAELYRKYPYDLHVQNLYETLRVEDMHRVWSEARFVNEWGGVKEYRFLGGAEATITPVLKLFSTFLHMHSLEGKGAAKYAYSWDRLGFGFSWIMLPSLTITQSASWDALKTGDLGSYTRVEWRANDYFKATASFDSFSLDIPLRARATGIKGKTALLNLDYRESELRDYNLVLLSNWLSDGNFNPGIILGFDQNIINQPDWKVRLGPEFYYGRYSKDPNVVPYFSPNFEYSLMLRPSLQVTHFSRYDKLVRSNLYTHVGLYREWGFAFYPIAGVRYEQEIKLSKTFWLTWTVGYYTRVYDGEYTNAVDGFLTINKKF
jgi:biofilm PGA synthesis protein PgaA